MKVLKIIMNKKELASRETRKLIIDKSRELFISDGFNNVSLNQIAESLGMTRGALYHHYKNKEDIFINVLEEVQKEVAEYIEQKALEEDDPWDQLVYGCIAFVRKATEEDVVKLLLIDGPSVIPWSKWKEMDNNNSTKTLIEQLDILRRNNLLDNLNINHSAHLISGALNELAIYIASGNTISNEEMESCITNLLRGFKCNG